VGCGKAPEIDRAKTIAFTRSNPPEITTIGRICDLISLPRSSIIFMGTFSQFSVARELLQRGEMEQALAEVDRVVGLFGKSVEALELEVEIRGAIVAKNRSPEEEAQIWFDRGWQFYLAGDFQNAIIAYNQAVQIKSDHHEAWFNRGTMLWHLARYEAALLSYEQAIQVKPDKYEAWNAHGITLANLGRYEEALAFYDQAIQIKPNYYDAWEGKGFALSHLERYEEQVLCYDQAIKCKPNSHTAFHDRGEALYRLERYQEALESCDQALIFKSDYANAWLVRGNALIKLENLDKALEAFAQAIYHKPDYARAWLNNSAVLFKLNRYEESIASCDQALKIKPDYYMAWENRSNGAFSGHGSQESNLFTNLHPELNQRGYQGELASLKIGLIYCSSTHCPIGHGDLQRWIGTAHWDHARTQASPRPYWREALKAYNASLSVLTASDHPEERLQTLQKLIRTHIALTEIPAARHYQTEGITLFQQLRAIARDKRQFEAQFSDFRRTEIDLLIGENAPTQALEQTEFYKNRALTWILDDWQETVLSPSYSQMRQLLRPDSAIVYWHLSDDALTTFILTPDSPEPIVLPTDRYQQSIDLKKLIDEYKKDYKTYRELPKDAKKDDHPWRLKLQSWLDRLKQILAIDTIETHIGNAKNIILLPHRDLHLLPIHAGFADRFTCTYLPSIQIGLNQPDRSPDHDAPTLLNIDDPIVDGQPPLVYSRIESAIVRALFPQTTRLTGTAATHEATIAALKQPHSIFHFSGHGRYDEYRPENSAIGLTDQNLTAKTIAALDPDLAAYDLINLAACETGITGKDTIATEYVGLASACLKARAGNVLSTLWQVDELSSAWLVVRFYQAYLAGEAAADALSIAQTWLRTITWAELATWLEQLIQAYPQMDYIDPLTAHSANILENQGKLESNQPPFAAPYYWAGFRLMGPSHK
jgi:CHAT domain-containing protein/Tfp pilus assembly protein PilF